MVARDAGLQLADGSGSISRNTPMTSTGALAGASGNGTEPER
jgi:hypothetical protein